MDAAKHWQPHPAPCLLCFARDLNSERCRLLCTSLLMLACSTNAGLLAEVYRGEKQGRWQASSQAGRKGRQGNSQPAPVRACLSCISRSFTTPGVPTVPQGPASPEVNMRGALSKAMRQRHPDAPERVQWHAGVLLPHGVKLTNGSWSPRHDW